MKVIAVAYETFSEPFDFRAQHLIPRFVPSVLLRHYTQHLFDEHEGRVAVILVVRCTLYKIRYMHIFI